MTARGVAGEPSADPVPAGGLSDRFKRGAEVARLLVERIVEGPLPPGTSLGSERELVAGFGVSRAVLREAVRILEHLGVASMRTGRAGGLLVTTPSSRAAGAAALVYLRYRGVRGAHLRTARRELVGLVAELAVRRRGGGPLAPGATGEAGRFGSLRRLEDHLSAALGNPVLTLLVRMLRRMTEELTRPPVAVEAPGAAGAAAEGLEGEEAALRAALERGDPEAARAAARAYHDAALRWPGER